MDPTATLATHGAHPSLTLCYRAGMVGDVVTAATYVVVGLRNTVF